MKPFPMGVPADLLAPHTLANVYADTPIAVALSGGADSVALLHMLMQMGYTVRAVHVHHGIRGTEADRDADFCRALATRLHVALEVLTLNVPRLARERGQSMETAAREARYHAIADWMCTEGLTVLATAHHANDQLETILQHLLRGSGLRGLCGIPAARPLGTHATVVRPLLCVAKSDILAYCTAQGLDFVHDSTNAERCCTRNRLRLDVIPALAELQPQAARLAARCAQNLAEDEAYLTELAEDFLANEGHTPSVAALGRLPRPIFVRVLRALVPLDLAKSHFDALWQLVRSATPHAALSIPPNTVARIEGGRLVLTQGHDAPPSDYEISLTEGVHPIPEIDGLAVLLRTRDLPTYIPDRIFSHTVCIRFAASCVQGTLRVRPRRAGDRILHGHLHKAVRKLPELASLPLALRARMPLLADDAGVLAVPYSLLRDGAANDPDSAVLLFFN